MVITSTRYYTRKIICEKNLAPPPTHALFKAICLNLTRVTENNQSERRSLKRSGRSCQSLLMNCGQPV